MLMRPVRAYRTSGTATSGTATSGTAVATERLPRGAVDGGRGRPQRLEVGVLRLGGRVDAQLGRQQPAEALVGAHRGGAVTTVEVDLHQPPVGGLPERLEPHHLLQRPDGLRPSL